MSTKADEANKANEAIGADVDNEAILADVADDANSSNNASRTMWPIRPTMMQLTRLVMMQPIRLTRHCCH